MEETQQETYGAGEHGWFPLWSGPAAHFIPDAEMDTVCTLPAINQRQQSQTVLLGRLDCFRGPKVKSVEDISKCFSFQYSF